jgi:hypothetical protein
MYKVVCDGNKCRRVKVTKAKKSSLEERIERRMHSEQTRRKSKTRKSPKSPKRKSPKRKSPKRKSRKKRHKYDEAWAKGMVTHVGPGGGGGTNNYTGAKRVPSRTILDDRKKRIDAIYKIFYEILDTDIVCARELFGDALRSPDDWRDPPQYRDREHLKDTLRTLKREKKAFCTPKRK